jgi:DNA polymerase family A/3'-5' exonuclease
MSITATENSIVRIGDREFPYQRPWDGRALTNRGFLAFDTETEAIDNSDRRPPRLALATASAGDAASAVIHPEQVGRFILAHPRARYVIHNAAFDFAVIDRHLQECGEEDARRAWWDACESNRMHDTMILDQLIELARRDADPRPRNLAVIGSAYARMEISKEDPFRLRFGELIDVDWAGVEDGFFSYAIKDVIVTLRAFRTMLLEAQRLMAEAAGEGPGMTDEVLSRCGALSEFIQVKGAIALARIERFGMHLDLDRVRTAEMSLRAGLEASVTGLRAICPELFKTQQDPATDETILCRTRNGAPSISEQVLQQQLQRVIDEIRESTGQELAIPTTERTGKLQTSGKVWAEHAHLHPFLECWLSLKDQAKLCQFFVALREPVVRPRYRHLLRTGRTGCSRPNIQQIPRDGQFRQAFVPSPGHLLLAVDFSFIELRTLAAHCLKVYGQSELAKVIRAGSDPHAHTAAMIVGVPYEDFLGWKDDATVIELNGKTQARKTHFKEARQLAKPVNFGVPGGLGAASLVAYARHTYKVNMTLEQAGEFRTRLIEEIYPELKIYLDEDGMSLLAHNLGVPVGEVWSAFDREGTRCRYTALGIRNIVRGQTLNARGRPYSPWYSNRVWDGLVRLCRNPEIRPLLESRRGDERLCNRLFGNTVVTLTGRIRGGVSYSQCRNTPFQGLAADGAKLGLWRLIREGFRVIAFVHDEVLIELPDEGGYVSKASIARITEILCSEMQSVLGGDLPVDVEYALSTCWSKDAKLIEADGKVYPWRPEKSEAG